MAKIDSAYDYYISTYGNQKTSRYDAHKKSDLRKIYNTIVKSNKDSPLYKISDMESAKRYAIDIKEGAKSIQNVVASLSDRYGTFSDSFLKKVAISSDSDTVSVEYIGDGSEKNSANQFEVQVNKLASPQINTGNFLKPNALSFIPGSYSFDLNVGNSAYELQYNVNAGETNGDVLSKLSRLINGSNLGIDSQVINNENGESALSLVSKVTGLASDESSLFSISPSGSSESIHAMDLLGINNITEEASNSDFLLNGNRQTSLSNTFSVNNTFELSLKQITAKDQTVTIGFKADTDAAADNIQKLVDVYNRILKKADEYSASDSNRNTRLLSDMSSVSKIRKTNLESIGLMVSDKGSITINRDTLSEAITPERANDTFHILSEFKDAVGVKADNASVNPMHYVDKVIVEYKNPGHNFISPYVSSIYSGMMLDSYI